MSYTDDWVLVYEAHFRRIDDDEVRTWDKEIKASIKVLGPHEIVEAVRYLSSMADEKSRCPGVGHIIRAIRHKRKMEYHGPGGRQCDLCGGSGWITFSFVTDPVDGTFLLNGSLRRIVEEDYEAHTAVTYCRCTGGKVAMDRDILSGKTNNDRAMSLQRLVFEKQGAK